MWHKGSCNTRIAFPLIIGVTFPLFYLLKYYIFPGWYSFFAFLSEFIFCFFKENTFVCTADITLSQNLKLKGRILLSTEKLASSKLRIKSIIISKNKSWLECGKNSTLAQLNDEAVVAQSCKIRTFNPINYPLYSIKHFLLLLLLFL